LGPLLRRLDKSQCATDVLTMVLATLLCLLSTLVSTVNKNVRVLYGVYKELTVSYLRAMGTTEVVCVFAVQICDEGQRTLEEGLVILFCSSSMEDGGYNP